MKILKSKEDKKIVRSPLIHHTATMDTLLIALPRIQKLIISTYLQKLQLVA